MARTNASYEILNGVRRTKALLVAGHQEALARIDSGGAYSPPTMIPIADLRVVSRYKWFIDASSSYAQQKRWFDLLAVARSNTSTYPFRDAIIVQFISFQRANRGKHVADIDVV